MEIKLVKSNYQLDACNPTRLKKIQASLKAMYQYNVYTPKDMFIERILYNEITHKLCEYKEKHNLVPKYVPDKFDAYYIMALDRHGTKPLPCLIMEEGLVTLKSGSSSPFNEEELEAAFQIWNAEQQAQQQAQQQQVQQQQVMGQPAEQQAATRPFSNGTGNYIPVPNNIEILNAIQYLESLLNGNGNSYINMNNPVMVPFQDCFAAIMQGQQQAQQQQAQQQQAQQQQVEQQQLQQEPQQAQQHVDAVNVLKEKKYFNYSQEELSSVDPSSIVTNYRQLSKKQKNNPLLYAACKSACDEGLEKISVTKGSSTDSIEFRNQIDKVLRVVSHDTNNGFVLFENVASK